MRRVIAIVVIALGAIAILRLGDGWDGISSPTEKRLGEPSGPPPNTVGHRSLTPRIFSKEELMPPDRGGASSTAEVGDHAWSSETEAMLDAVIRSLGGSVWDIRELQCHSIYCEAVVIHDPSLIYLDPAARAVAAVSFERNLQAAMEGVYRATPRLGATEVSDMYLIVSGAPNEVVHAQYLATRLTTTGPPEPGD